MEGKDTIGVDKIDCFDYEGQYDLCFIRPPKRRRFGKHVLKSSFLEALTIQVALNVSRNFGRLAVASALCNLFQICSSWRAVCRSQLLWKHLTTIVWDRKYQHEVTWNWHEEYIYRHQTTHNFDANKCTLTTIPFPPPPPPPAEDVWNNDHICLRLALSNHYFAAGYSHGIVQVYEKATGAKFGIFTAEQHDRFGRFSSAVTGIILNDYHLIFATLDGYIYRATFALTFLHIVHSGNIFRDGSMVDFDGDNVQWWVGLYVGVLGHAFHVWNAFSEEKIFVGGTLTDPEYLQCWLLHANISILVGRLKVSGNGVVTACTSRRAIEFRLDNLGVPLVVPLDKEQYKPNPDDLAQRIRWEEYIPSPNDQTLMIRCFDITNEFTMLMQGNGWLSTRANLNYENDRIRVTDTGVVDEQVAGCMNNQFIMIYEPIEEGVISFFRVHDGKFLNRVHERLDGVIALVADGTHLLASTSTSLRIWRLCPS